MDDSKKRRTRVRAFFRSRDLICLEGGMPSKSTYGIKQAVHRARDRVNTVRSTYRTGQLADPRSSLEELVGLCCDLEVTNSDRERDG